MWVEIDDKQFESYVYDFYDKSASQIKSIVKKEYQDDDDDDEAVKTVKKQMKVLTDLFDSSGYISNIIKRARPKLYNVKFLTELNNAHSFYPLANGKKIDMKTMEITDRTQQDFFTYCADVSYVEETPNANKFFKQIQPNKENREYVRKVLGYNLTGETKARKFFVWYGFGSNGKSKIFSILQKLLCCQYVQLDRSIFMKTKKSGGAATPELMVLLGARAGCYSEGETADNIEMNVGGVKQTSGEDWLTGRPLYCKQVSFKPFVKLNLLTNYAPPLDAQKAIVERLNYTFMDASFTEKPDKNQKNEFEKDDKFADQLENEYLSEVFSWMVKGANNYYKDGKLDMTDEFQKRTDELLTGEDSIKTYLDRFVEKTENFKDNVKKVDIWEKYRSFCDKNSQRCQPRSSLYNRLAQMKIKTTILHGFDVFREIKIKDNEEISDQELDDKRI